MQQRFLGFIFCQIFHAFKHFVSIFLYSKWPEQVPFTGNTGKNVYVWKYILAIQEETYL